MRDERGNLEAAGSEWRLPVELNAGVLPWKVGGGDGGGGGEESGRRRGRRRVKLLYLNYPFVVWGRITRDAVVLGGK